MSRLGLVVALPREIPTGFVRISHHERVLSRPIAVYQHKRAATQLVAVQAGVGYTRAIEGARLLIRRFSPEALVSFGFAGGLVPQVRRGALIIGTALVSDASPEIMSRAHHNLIAQFHAAAEAEGVPVHRGAVVTSQQIVSEVAAKTALRRQSGACAVDMETAGIVYAASEAGLPWVAVRAIVDGATDALPAGYLTTLRDDGQVASKLLLRAICCSPALVLHLLALGKGAVLARRHLSRVVERWAVDLPAQRPLVGG